MIYLASLYSLGAHTDSIADQKQRECRYEYAMMRTAEMMKAGNTVFSPITHCHNMSVVYDMPKSYGFWQQYDREMIERSDQVVVLCMEAWDGKTWKDSEGITDEVSFARSIGKPVLYLKCPDFVDIDPTEELTTMEEALHGLEKVRDAFKPNINPHMKGLMECSEENKIDPVEVRYGS